LIKKYPELAVMDVKNRAIQKGGKFWVGISPWIIIGALVILIPSFIAMTVVNLNKQKEYTTQLLVEKGAALMRSFEAGARTGLGMQWSSFQLQKLLIETAQQPDIDHLIVTDDHGIILADSDPSMIGETYGNDLDLLRIAGSKQVEWRQVPNPVGADTFEVFRQFSPTGEPFQGFQAGGKTDKNAPGFIIFVGMDMGPVIAAREQDSRHTIWMAVIFLLIGCSGIISLFLAQGYRSVKTSFSRMKAFSDNLVENMPMGLAAISVQGDIVSFNQTAESILGHAAGDVLGKKAEDVLPQPCLALIHSLGTGKIFLEKEMDCPVKDGKIIPLEVIVTTLEEEGGKFLGYVILFRDITEIQHLKKEMAKSQRLAALGNLAAGIAHEIRNPLSSIKGFATFFKERYGGNPEDVKTAAIMIQEVDRLNRVISQLLEFARPMDLHKERTSLQGIIHHTLKMIEDQSRLKGIMIQADLSPHVGDALIDSDKLTQVFLNVYLNALEAMEKGGTLSVNLSLRNDRTIRIDISDTGRGIDRDEAARIFDPYFTTRPTGTGLGLAIVHKIIEAHGGEIRVDSVRGEGTTFSIFLPGG
jgi:two-component system sensor histidine kinase HydH